MLDKLKQSRLYIAELVLLLASLLLLLVPRAHYTFYGDNFEFEQGVPMESLGEVAYPGVYVDNSMFEEGQETVEILTPPANLHPGSYEVHLKYINTDHNNTFTASSDYNTYPVLTKRINWGLEEIETPEEETVFRLQSWQKVDGYRVSFNYTGNGYIYAYGLEIVETNWWKIELFLIILGLSAALNIFLHLKETMDSKVLFGYLYALAIGIMAAMPMLGIFFLRGDDSAYHIGRLEALANAIANGDLPLRVSNLWMDGKGYASALFYCDIFLFPSSLIRALGSSLQGAWKTYEVGVNIVTALLGYHCFRKMTKTNMGAMISVTIHVLSAYRMHCMYGRFAVGDYTAQMFLPLVLYGLYRIYTEEIDSRKSIMDNFRIALPFTIGVSCLVMSHIQSTLMSALFIFAFILINWKKTFTRNVITRLFSALAGILVFNMWFIFPFLEMAGSLRFTEDSSSLGRYAANGTLLYQLFNLFPQGTGISYAIFESHDNNFAAEMPFTLGAASIGVVIYLILRLTGLIRKNAKGDKLLIAAIMGMFMTTVYFPWDFFEQLSPVLESLTHTLMCPWRFVGISCVLSSTLSGVLYDELVEEKDRLSRFAMPVALAIIIFSFIGGGYYITTKAANGTWTDAYDEEGFNYSIIGGEYLPDGFDDVNYLATEPMPGEGVTVTDTYREGKYLYVTAQNSSGDVSFVDTHIIYYKGYRSADCESGTRLNTSKAEHAFTRVELPAGYNGTFRVWYSEPGYWRVYEAVSVISILGYIVYRLLNRKKKAYA